MRFTFPALITSSIKLCRRYKNRQHVVCTLFAFDTPSTYFIDVLGRRMGDESSRDPQIRTAGYCHSRNTSGGANDRTAIVPPLCTDR